MPMFIAALSVVAKTWKWPKYLPVGECLRKIWYISIKKWKVTICDNIDGAGGYYAKWKKSR